MAFAQAGIKPPFSKEKVHTSYHCDRPTNDESFINTIVNKFFVGGPKEGLRSPYVWASFVCNDDHTIYHCWKMEIMEPFDNW